MSRGRNIFTATRQRVIRTIPPSRTGSGEQEMPNSAAPGPLEFYKIRFEIENSLTRSVLKAIPPDKLDYRPHERSPSTGQIAWTIVRGLFIRIDMASQVAERRDT